jgi:hypothetical protein
MPSRWLIEVTDTSSLKLQSKCPIGLGSCLQAISDNCCTIGQYLLGVLMLQGTRSVLASSSRTARSVRVASRRATLSTCNRCRQILETYSLLLVTRLEKIDALTVRKSKSLYLLEACPFNVGLARTDPRHYQHCSQSVDHELLEALALTPRATRRAIITTFATPLQARSRQAQRTGLLVFLLLEGR